MIIDPKYDIILNMPGSDGGTYTITMKAHSRREIVEELMTLLANDWNCFGEDGDTITVKLHEED